MRHTIAILIAIMMMLGITSCSRNTTNNNSLLNPTQPADTIDGL